MREELSVERMLANARELAFPRYPGTEGDARAIRLVAERMAETGLAVGVEEFSYDLRPAWRALRFLLAGCGVLLLGAGVLAARQPALAAALCGGAVLAAGSFLAWSPWLERLYQAAGTTRTANVEARRSASNPRLRLVLLAHHDSKSQNLTLPVRVGLTLLALLGTLGLAAWLAATGLGLRQGPGTGAAPGSGALAGREGLGQAAGPGPGWGGASLPLAAGAVAGGALFALAALRSGNRSPGGVDNAGSVAILLELARVLPGELATDVEVIFLATGAEEDHMIGAMRWLAAHRSELAERPVWGLNFDGAGAPGRTVLLERYGLGRSFSRELSAAALACAARLGDRVRRVLLPPGMGVDAIPFAHHGVPCLTLSSGSLGAAVLAVHSVGDRAEHLDGEALARVARLGREMALQLAGVSRRA